jgi:DeoR family fructose operon transcriptional repressor
MEMGATSKPPTPFGAERRQQILNALRADGRVDAADLSFRMGVTGETLRKDLIQLELNGLLRRVHGGAVPVEQLSYEPAVSVRTEFAAEKTRIARSALDHLPHRGSILVDAGSTTALLAEMLPGDIELTVYTNTLPVALELVNRPRLTVFTLGGRLRSRTLAEVDDFAARALAEINVDVAFLGTNGISLERGLTTPDPAEAAVKRLMLGAARRRIFLADHSKVGLVRGSQHAEIGDIDLLITDDGLAASARKPLRRAGVDVSYA